MKKIKSYGSSLLITAVIAATLWACGPSEKEQLQATVDSLKTEIAKNRKAEAALISIGKTLDSIDQDRHLMKANLVRTIDHRNYVVRLRNINRHVSEIESRVKVLQASLRKAEQQADATGILRKRLVKAEADAARLQTSASAIQQDNAIAIEMVYVNNARIAAAEQELLDKDQLLLNLRYQATAMDHIQQDRRAEFYYQQALILEETARRTRFAPGKKRETSDEAIELYRIAGSLGKEEATRRLAVISKTKS